VFKKTRGNIREWSVGVGIKAAWVWCGIGVSTSSIGPKHGAVPAVVGGPTAVRPGTDGNRHSQLVRRGPGPPPVNRVSPKAGGNRPLGEQVFAHGTTICASALGALSPAALAAVTRTFTVLPPEDSPPYPPRRLRPRRNTNGRASAIFFAPFAPWRLGVQKQTQRRQDAPTEIPRTADQVQPSTLSPRLERPKAQQPLRAAAETRWRRAGLFEPKIYRLPPAQRGGRATVCLSDAVRQPTRLVACHVGCCPAFPPLSFPRAARSSCCCLLISAVSPQSGMNRAQGFIQRRRHYANRTAEVVNRCRDLPCHAFKSPLSSS
jgi:hypothetical protein